MTSVYGTYQVFDDWFIRQQLQRLQRRREQKTDGNNGDIGGGACSAQRTPIAPSSDGPWEGFTRLFPDQAFLLGYTNFTSFINTSSTKSPQTICVPATMNAETPLDYYEARKVVEHFWFPARVPFKTLLEQNHGCGEVMDLFNIHHRQVPFCVSADGLSVAGYAVVHATELPSGVTIWVLDADYRSLAQVASIDFRATG